MARPALQRTVTQLVQDPAAEREEPKEDKSEKRQKPQNELREAPAGTPIPRDGFPAARYWFYKRVGRPDWVPKPNKNEQFANEVKSLEDRLRYLADNMQITVSFLNVKGGSSKTTTSIYVGSIITDVTKLTGYVLPATAATETCTAALKAGLAPEETLSISEFVQKCGELQSYRDLSRLVKPTQWGLRVIAEDPVSEVSLDKKFGRMRFREIAETLRRNADLAIYDTGNDNVARNSVPLEAARSSDVLVFTATADTPETLEKLSYTMRRYLTDEVTKPQQEAGDDGIRAEGQIPTAEKARRSLVVISRVGKKETAQDYVDYTKQRDKYGTVIKDIGFDGDIIVVPDDPYLANKDNVVADLDAIRSETYRAYLRLAVAIYEKAAELRGLDL